MPKMKFGVGDKVSTESGFAPYEGPLPKPNVIYPVVQKSATIRLTGENSKAPGTAYISSVWEIESGDCKGFTAFHRLIPGEHEIQQTRIAQYMQAVTGKNSADVVHDEIEDGGKVNRIGGKKPEGVKAGMTFQRKKDTRNANEGEEPEMIAESSDLIPGWKPKAVVVEIAEDEVPADEEIEDDEEEAVVEEDDDDADEDSEEDEDDSDEDEEDDSEEEGEDELTPYVDAAAMSLVQLKAFAKENEYDPKDLLQYKGPKGKKALLALLVEDEIVAAEDAEDEPPF